MTPVGLNSGEAVALADTLLLDVADLPELEEDRPPTIPAFSWMEAIHRLTMGVPGAWADEASVRRLLAVFKQRTGQCPGLAIHALRQGGLVQNESYQHARRGIGERGRGGLFRLTPEGAAEHLAWRHILLPSVERVAS